MSDSIESVQRRATRAIPSLRHLAYSNRLQALDLPSLWFRRFREDLIATYKVANGNQGMREALEYRHRDPRTRGHPLSIFKENRGNKYRRTFLLQRVCDCWNSLPENMVCASSINVFKSFNEAHFNEHPKRYNHKAILEEPYRLRVCIRMHG